VNRRFDYAMTQEHREDPIIFAAICCRDPLGQAGWAKLYRGYVESPPVTAGAEACRPLGRQLSVIARH
jgi:hypothetical protein